MSVAERRHHPRFPFHSRGFLAINGQQHLGTILDVSLKGALFASTEPLSLRRGAVCRLEIFHAGQESVCNAAAVVAHLRDDGLLGLHLVEPDAAVQLVLQQVMDMNLGTPTLLERDLPEMLAPATGRA
jgi:hypothetical protein